jgi:hypothetical protein
VQLAVAQSDREAMEKRQVAAQAKIAKQAAMITKVGGVAPGDVTAWVSTTVHDGPVVCMQLQEDVKNIQENIQSLVDAPLKAAEERFQGEKSVLISRIVSIEADIARTRSDNRAKTRHIEELEAALEVRCHADVLADPSACACLCGRRATLTVGCGCVSCAAGTAIRSCCGGPEPAGTSRKGAHAGEGA